MTTKECSIHTRGVVPDDIRARCISKGLNPDSAVCMGVDDNDRHFWAAQVLANDPIQPAATDGRSMEKRVIAARLQWMVRGLRPSATSSTLDDRRTALRSASYHTTAATAIIFRGACRKSQPRQIQASHRRDESLVMRGDARVLLRFLGLR